MPWSFNHDSTRTNQRGFSETSVHGLMDLRLRLAKNLVIHFSRGDRVGTPYVVSVQSTAIYLNRWVLPFMEGFMWAKLASLLIEVGVPQFRL